MGEGRESRDGRKGHGREDDHLLQEPPFVHFCGALAAAKFLLPDTHCTISSKTTTVVVDEDVLARALINFILKPEQELAVTTLLLEELFWQFCPQDMAKV